jgi:hypothetical protein
MVSQSQIVRELGTERSRIQAHLNSLDHAISTLRGLNGSRTTTSDVYSGKETDRAAKKARWAKWRAQREK